MIRKILFLLVLFSGFFACKEDEDLSFDVPVEFRKLDFQPVPGGAMMKYYVKNADVYGVRVRYSDAWGELRTREGSYLGDTLLLTGFTEARQNVPAQISFFNRSFVESEAIEATFNTENSATVALFDSLRVQEFWGGFSVSYTAPETVTGMVHVFYMGTNPLTGELDSILMSSTPIKSGGDTLNFEMSQVMETTDVIVRTDDFDGKRVKLQVYKSLPCLSMDTLKYEDDFLYEFGGKTVTNATHGFGLEYLFDGDKRGIGFRRNKLAGVQYKYDTYVVGPNAFYHEGAKENRFIIDLKQERVPAAVSLYAFLNYQTSWPKNGESSTVVFPDLVSDIWNGQYYAHLPAKAKLYGTNSDPKTVDLSSCVLLYELDDDVDDLWNSWATRTDCLGGQGGAGWREDWRQGDEKDVLAADPVVLRMLCNYEAGRKFRYLILVVTDTYDNVGNWYQPEANAREYVTFNEMEVCIKAE